MLSFSKNDFRSLVFAFIYVFVPYRLYLGRFVLGEFLASTFLPLVFLGFYEIILEITKMVSIKYWLIFSSICSYFKHLFNFEIFLIILIAKFFVGKRLTVDRIKYLLQSALLTILLVAPIIVPFFTDYIGKGIKAPYQQIGILNDASILLEQSFSNIAENSSIGLVLLVTLFLGWSWSYKGLNKEIYLLGIIFTIISTSIFPWKSFDKGLLSTVQLPFRYLIYAALFLSIIASSKISSLLKVISLKKLNFSKKYILSLIIMSIGLLSFYGSTYNVGSEVYPFNPNAYLKKTYKVVIFSNFNLLSSTIKIILISLTILFLLVKLITIRKMLNQIVLQ
ncbi:hypothetical protein [Liquorilactobacillus vini]|uniref:hypothetical protein n=1 Tax=Liquorilactobacillus vini TaxID=238015 RepID=UPI000302773E|nr:hypothetical protein [Liquorilactobacillus vini]